MLKELTHANDLLDEAINKIDMENPDVDEPVSIMTHDLIPVLANIGDLTPEEFIEIFIKKGEHNRVRAEVTRAALLIQQISGVHEMAQASAEDAD